MKDISSTLVVLKWFNPFISFNLLHPENISFISATFEVSKFDKSKYSNSEHDLNIDDIFSTLVVLKLFNPFISFNLLQPANISSISIMFEVSKSDKYIEIILERSK